MVSKSSNKRRRRYNRKRKRYFKRKARKNLARPFPQSFLTKLRYTELISLNPPATASVDDYVFRANDCYDPNLTGIGHQPRGFDQWMTVYQQWVVVGSAINVKFSDGDNNTYEAVVGVNLNTLSTIDSNEIIDMIEDRKVRYKITNNDRPVTCTEKFSSKKWFKSKPMSDDTLHGTATNGPANLTYYHVWAGDMNSLEDVQSVNAIVTIDYLVVFFDPIQPTQS